MFESRRAGTSLLSRPVKLFCEGIPTCVGTHVAGCLFFCYFDSLWRMHGTLKQAKKSKFSVCKAGAVQKPVYSPRIGEAYPGPPLEALGGSKN